MGLNIKKRQRVRHLARILPQATGKPMSRVIEEALEEKLIQLERDREMRGKVAWLEERLKQLHHLASPATIPSFMQSTVCPHDR